MKPANWDKLSKDKKQQYAKNLYSSLRGMYVIGQALSIASVVMKNTQYPEVSNIEDMEILLEELFPIGLAAEEPRFVALREKVVKILANFDDILKSVGIKKLRDEYKVGKCVSVIQKELNDLLRVVSGR